MKNVFKVISILCIVVGLGAIAYGLYETASGIYYDLILTLAGLFALYLSRFLWKQSKQLKNTK